jgi:hypothetical protein
VLCLLKLLKKQCGAFVGFFSADSFL